MFKCVDTADYNLVLEKILPYAKICIDMEAILLNEMRDKG